MKSVQFTLVAAALLAALIAGCAPAAPAATQTPVPPPATPTTIPSPTPVPATATSTPYPVILTDGTNRWGLMDVTYGDNPQYPGPSGYYPMPGYTYLTLVFDSMDGASLITVAMGQNFEGILKVSVPGGFKMAYVTDKEGTKYHAVEIGQAHLIIPVPEGSSGFTLHLADLAPIEIED